MTKLMTAFAALALTACLTSDDATPDTTLAERPARVCTKWVGDPNYYWGCMRTCCSILDPSSCVVEYALNIDNLCFPSVIAP